MEYVNQQSSPQSPPAFTSVPPPASDNPPEQNSLLGSKTNWLKWVLIIIFVTLLSSGGTYFVLNQKNTKQSQPTIVKPSPSPAPIQDPNIQWSTYLNPWYGFSFKYPSTKFKYFSVKKATSDRFLAHLATRDVERDPDGKQIELQAPGFNIYIDINKNSLSLDDFASKYYDAQTDQKERALIKSQTWYKYFHDPCKKICEVPAIFSYTGVTKKGSFIYTISLNDKRLLDKDKQFLDQLLSTFKFFDPQPPPNDTGKPCTDGSQCLSELCKGIAGKSQGKGLCAADPNECGCYDIVTDGSPTTRSICVECTAP